MVTLAKKLGQKTFLKKEPFLEFTETFVFVTTSFVQDCRQDAALKKWILICMKLESFYQLSPRNSYLFCNSTYCVDLQGIITQGSKAVS